MNNTKRVYYEESVFVLNDLYTKHNSTNAVLKGGSSRDSNK